jgi:hypothetical protein
MDVANQTPPQGKAQLWAGRALSGLLVFALAGSASLKLMGKPEMAQMMTEKFGFKPEMLQRLGMLELLCVVLYAVPQTSVFGALLITGYLGGAVCTHVRVGDPFAAPLILGVMAWVGLFLREPRLRALLPLRSLSR